MHRPLLLTLALIASTQSASIEAGEPAAPATTRAGDPFPAVSVYDRVMVPIADLVALTSEALPASGFSTIEVNGRAFNLTPTSTKTVEATKARVVSGKLLDEPGSFVFAQVDGFVSGAIWTTNGAVEFRPSDASGLTTPIDIDRADLPSCLTPGLFNDARPAPRPAIDLGGARDTALRGDAEQVVRVFVGITEAAEAQVGGASAARAIAPAAIESTNTAYANSLMTFNDEGLVATTVELTGTFTVDGQGMSAGSLLSALRGINDGVMDELHPLRDASKSDLVALLARSGIGACGIAYLAPNDATRGFSVTAQSCAVGNLSFAHELGHNFGASHDADNAGSGVTPYGFGWRWNTSGGSLRRSVMAYAPGFRRPYFSNPQVSDGGGVTGNASVADNARLISETFPILAQYRIGTIDATDDCDGNGVVDALELVLDPSLDSDLSGTLDSCDLQNGLLDDCNEDGIADIGQIRPRVVMTPNAIALNGFPPIETSLGEPLETDGDVTLSLSANADLDATNEYIDMFINGIPLGRYWQNDGAECDAAIATAELTIDESTWNSLTPPVVISAQRSAAVNANGCSGNTISVSLEYTGINRVFDANADGVLDACEQNCSIADIAEPFGILDLGDIGAFVASFGQGEPQADIAEPFGVLDLGDISAFIEAFAQGCP